MLENLYDFITKEAVELHKNGKERFNDTKGTPQGYLGVAVEDTSTLLIGIQNILASHLGKNIIKLDLGSPSSIDDPNSLFSAMKSVHKYFFISIQASLEAAAERVCEKRNIIGIKHERAFMRALTFLTKKQKDKCKSFYDALKIIRNECAHPSTGEIHDASLHKINNAGLAFLLEGKRFKINCSKYQPVIDIAYQCIAQWDEIISA